jgi:WhiB family redox-sensing transcriptional regulator
VTRDWIRDADCAGTDPELFFADDDASQYIAKRICARCPVLLICRQEAMTDEGAVAAAGRFGVRGGLTHKERAYLKRNGRLPRQQPTTSDLEQVA